MPGWGGWGGFGSGGDDGISYNSSNNESSSDSSEPEETREQYLARRQHERDYGECLHCGRETYRSNTYCTHCGKKWDYKEPEKEYANFCPNGHGRSSGRYCGSCGEELEEREV